MSGIEDMPGPSSGHGVPRRPACRKGGVVAVAPGEQSLTLCPRAPGSPPSPYLHGLGMRPWARWGIP